ncbi:MAG: AMP-binding protein [Ramlibacter sp.]|nr:AMP-binding protein [Ramlibacter sp.]
MNRNELPLSVVESAPTEPLRNRDGVAAVFSNQHWLGADDTTVLLSHRTIVERLFYWGAVCPDKTAYTFLKDKGQLADELKFSGLCHLVSARAADLDARGLSGQRVLLVLASGLDYLVAFLACLAAGVVAVPMYPPSTKRDWDKLGAVAKNCTPAAVILDRKVVERDRSAFDGIFPGQTAALIYVDELPRTHALERRDDARPESSASYRKIDPRSIAFLQYTSGSTGNPKGVMVSHDNIVHNARQQAAGMGSNFRSVFVSWLPFYHDMGLIGIILQALSVGAHAVLMSPFSFLRSPGCWLRAISQYAGTISGAPNFAFDLCVEKITDAEITELDLSSWHTAFNGSEPVKTSTLERFAGRFSPAGFRSAAQFPCYGLAEATLYVSGGHARPEMLALSLDRTLLGANKIAPAADGAPSDSVVQIVNVQRFPSDLTTLIVEPETWKARPQGMVGEIWLKGKSITLGYWERPIETAETFRAYIADTGEGPFLRTGDLGFLKNGELFITGRIKELIIINGANYYPQDIEETVQSLGHPFRIHSGAAFALPDNGIAIVQGLNRTKLTADELQLEIDRIRRAVWESHGITPAFVGFVPPSDIAKTSSGKIQREHIRSKLIAGELSLIASWSATAVGPPTAPTHPAPLPATSALTVPAHCATVPTSPEARALITWIRDYFPRRVNSQLIDERRSIPPNIVLDMGNRGLLGMLAPRSAGGLEFSTSDFLRVLEALGAKDLTIALFVGLNNALGIRPIMAHGSAEVKARYLANLASGRELAAFALTEPGAGSNPGAISATAQHMPDGTYRVSGTKCWSGSAAWAGVMNVFARTVDAQGHVTGVTGFAIPQDSPGVQQGPEALTMGMRGMIQNTVILDGVVAQAHQVLGVPDHGMAVAQDTMCYGRLAIAAVCLGATKGCYQLMLRYAGRREISTGPLLANPHTRAMLTDTMHAIEVLGRLIEQVAGQKDGGIDVSPEILASCKCLATEWLWLTVDRTMQMAGGRGYIESNLIPQIFRDARIFRIFEGPTEALHHFLGTSAVRTPEVLRAYLLQRLDQATLSRYFDEVLEHPHIAQPHADGNGAAMHWRYLALGAYLSELVFFAAGRGAEASSLNWLEHRLSHARGLLDAAPQRLAGLATAEKLATFGRTIDDQIGIDLRSAPQPDTTCDPWLASHAPLAAEHSTSEPASIREIFPTPAVVAAAPASWRGPASDRLADITGFITEWITERCGLKLEAAGLDMEFSMLGLGSIDSSNLAQCLSDRFALDLDPTVLWNYPNTRELAAFIHRRFPQRSPGAGVADNPSRNTLNRSVGASL